LSSALNPINTDVADEAGRQASEQEQEQQHYQELAVPSLPPLLPTPLVDATFSIETVLEAAALYVVFVFEAH